MVNPSFVSNPYLTRQLIAYIGNKRSLLPFLSGIFQGLGHGPGTRFLDPFCGSGAVARLGRVLGYQVGANDWEPYARLVTEAHTAFTPKEVNNWFGSRGGAQHLRELLNSPPPAQEYLSKYYSPAHLDTADYTKERMFFTPSNGQYLDRARSLIESWYPGWELPEEQRREKVFLIAPLIYQASAHSNTSGVFKAFHKGFGGHGGDALKRIFHPMTWENPELWDSGPGAQVFGLDAQEFLKNQTADLIYLDPPYNQHQYGSNYHLLNTLTLWDKPEADLNFTPQGILKNKAGIRQDWIERRSPYCVRTQAPKSLKALLDQADARHIVLSYNTEGIIPFEEMYEILSSSGKVDLVIQPYVKYRGGRQSPLRAVHNSELVLILDRSSVPGSGSAVRVRRFLLLRKIQALLGVSFHPEKIKSRGWNQREAFHWQGNNRSFTCGTLHLWKFNLGKEDLEAWPTEDLEIFAKDLETLVCSDHGEEAQVLLDLLQNFPKEKNLARRLLWTLRKFAFKKYQTIYSRLALETKKLFLSEKELSPLLGDLEKLENQASKRFKG